MLFGKNSNFDEFHKVSKIVGTVVQALGQELANFVKNNSIDLSKLPPPEKWEEIYERWTDEQVGNAVTVLVNDGWLLYAFLDFLPLTELYDLLEKTNSPDLQQSLDKDMINILDVVIQQNNLGGRDEVIKALKYVDPIGGDKRISYLKQLLSAYESELYALIPPLAYAQLESLFAKFSAQTILSKNAKAFQRIFDKQKARKFVQDMNLSFSDREGRKGVGILLHTSYLQHLKAFENVLAILSQSSNTYDYTSIEDLEKRAHFVIPPRNYVAHGGLGIDTQIHAAKAIITLITSIFLLQQVKQLKNSY